MYLGLLNQRKGLSGEQDSLRNGVLGTKQVAWWLVVSDCKFKFIYRKIYESILSHITSKDFQKCQNWLSKLWGVHNQLLSQIGRSGERNVFCLISFWQREGDGARKRIHSQMYLSSLIMKPFISLTAFQVSRVGNWHQPFQLWYNGAYRWLTWNAMKWPTEHETGKNCCYMPRFSLELWTRNHHGSCSTELLNFIHTHPYFRITKLGKIPC